MSTQPNPQRPRARAALAAYLRLLAACLEDEAAMIENDPERSDDVLKRFREGVLSLSLEEAPLDALMDRLDTVPAASTLAVTGKSEGSNGAKKRQRRS